MWELMNEWSNEWKDQWKDECMEGWMKNGRINEWIRGNKQDKRRKEKKGNKDSR